jgi:cytochrome c oxidase subunit 3
MSTNTGYYLPEPSRWPITGSVGLFTLAVGAATALNGLGVGPVLMFIGVAIVIFMLFGWFGTVIRESERQMYNDQVDVSFRWGMGWFIFSEVMFFAAFFGALYYSRVYAVPWLGGEGAKALTHSVLWQGFESVWPLLEVPDATFFTKAHEAIGPGGLPLFNTIVLLSSGATVTWAHWGLKKNHRQQLIIGLLLTVILGFTFVGCQAYEYGHLYHEFDLQLDSGIYGSTFFMLTGFHGFHVTMGAIMLTVILLRSLKGHFTPQRHFAFEGVAWYWHFVDVVWLGLYLFVYWL